MGAHGHGYHTLRAIDARRPGRACSKVRKAGLGLLMAASQGTRRPLAFIEDTAVAARAPNDYVAEIRGAARRATGSRPASTATARSAACTSARSSTCARPARWTSCARSPRRSPSWCSRYGGVNSSEHGDGLVRSEFNRRMFGDELYEAMREVKRLFDPHGRLNPGKIVDAPADDRAPPRPGAAAGPAAAHAPRFDGPDGHAQRGRPLHEHRRCAARRRPASMCPSYMATREEDHATRGRANALVRALSQPDPHAALGDERLHEILDLCLECKACKSECPLGVDMASLKSEFLSHYQDDPRHAAALAGVRRDPAR